VTLIRVSKGALFGIGSSDACTGLTKRVDDQAGRRASCGAGRSVAMPDHGMRTMNSGSDVDP
jgi:hypothetical protein